MNLVPPSRSLDFEFAWRSTISLVLAATVGALALLLPSSGTSVDVLARSLRFAEPVPQAALAAVVASCLAAASLLRMAAGSALGADRLGDVRPRSDVLVARGPYRLVRNPVYAADLLATAALSLALPPVGLLLPVLLYVHLRRIVRLEEKALRATHGASYDTYARSVGRFVPSLGSWSEVGRAVSECTWTREGVRHDALYVSFAVGFAAVAAGAPAWVAWAVGAPAVLDWFVLRRRRAVEPDGPPTRAFDGVLYAQCWEDSATDRRALEIRAGDDVLCITSGGDKALAYLLDDPARVVAIDLNSRQNHLLELKREALVHLEHDELLELAGARSPVRGGDRLALYARIRSGLSAPARAWWDAHPDAISRGFLHAGRFEDYLAVLRRWIRRLVGPRALESLFTLPDEASRADWVRRHWDRAPRRAIQRLLSSRWLLSRLFDPRMFAFVPAGLHFGEHFERVARRALVELSPATNPFLQYALLGRFLGEEQLPVWMRPEHQEVLRRRVDRLKIETTGAGDWLESAPDGSISRFDFSNVFEWAPPEAHEAALRQVLRVGRAGSVVIYRNLLVPRARPASMAASLLADEGLARELLRRDPCFLYSGYVVERVAPVSLARSAP